MGYALFTARKLILQNRLNQMNYREMVLSQKQQDLADQAATMQMQNGYQSSLQTMLNNSSMAKAYDTLQSKISSGATGDALTQAVKDCQTASSNIQYSYSSAGDTAKLQNIQVVENQIDLEMKKLDTEIKATTAELEQVEKSEDTAIKNSAPKYGNS